MRTHNIPSYYRKIKVILIMPPDLALLSILIGSNYPCLELILMVPKVFEPLTFYCMSLSTTVVSLSKQCMHRLESSNAEACSRTAVRNVRPPDSAIPFSSVAGSGKIDDSSLSRWDYKRVGRKTLPLKTEGPANQVASEAI